MTILLQTRPFEGAFDSKQASADREQFWRSAAILVDILEDLRIENEKICQILGRLMFRR
jgi:hypothetical protein